MLVLRTWRRWQAGAGLASCFRAPASASALALTPVCVSRRKADDEYLRLVGRMRKLRMVADAACCY